MPDPIFDPSRRPLPPESQEELRRQIQTDLEHLRLLAIFHYIVGGLIALVGCIPIIHLSIGIALVFGKLDQKMGPGPDQEMTRFMGWIFIGVATAIILFNWSLAVALVVAGRNLQQHRRHTFCMVVAAISCLFMPLGTILGVFTLIVLSRESVKELFRAAEAEPA
jgi:hypothetical protein